MYFAIIGDIKNSKQLTNRYEVQETLKKTLNMINNKYSEDLKSLFSVTVGDEFQGLLTNSNHMLEMIDMIRFSMYPLEIRFGIGLGDISTKIIEKDSLGSDGPAYWAAREAIDYVHDINDYGITKIHMNIYSNIDPDNQKLISLINISNAMLALSDRFESSWIDSQQSFVRAVILKYGYDINCSQKDMAKELNMSSQLFNNKFKTTGIRTYIESRLALENIFNGKEGIID